MLTPFTRESMQARGGGGGAFLSLHPAATSSVPRTSQAPSTSFYLRGFPRFPHTHSLSRRCLRAPVYRLPVMATSAATAAPLELVFVVDGSGSMGGSPIQQVGSLGCTISTSLVGLQWEAARSSR